MKRLIGKMIVTSGIVVALAGCGSSASSASTQPNSAPAAAAATTTWTTVPDAASQGAPADASNQPEPAGSPQAPGGGGQGVMGQVVSIDGTTMVVKGQGDQGAEITVTLNDSTKYTKQTTVDIASVPVGEPVTAMGVQEGNVFTAAQLRIGATMDAGGPGGAGADGMPQAGGPSGADQQGRAGGNRGQRLSGTVEAVADGTLTVKTADGASILIRLAENGQVTQQVDGTQADITVGAQVMVVGEQTDSAVTATQVSVVPATAKQQ